MLGDPVTDIHIAMEIDYFRLARDRYFVPDRGQDSRQRTGAGQARRRREHRDRFHRRGQGRQGQGRAERPRLHYPSS